MDRKERLILPITYNVHSGVQLENDIRFTLEVTPEPTNYKSRRTNDYRFRFVVFCLLIRR